MKNLTDLKKKQQWITTGKVVANSSENFREILRKTFATWGWIAAMHLKLSGVATKAVAFEYFAYFTGKHLCWSLFNKFVGLQVNLIKTDALVAVHF